MNNTGKAIKWKYFFGGSSNNGRSYDRYYAAEINGQRCERHDSNRGRKFSIGNMDLAKIKYETQEELIEAINSTSLTQSKQKEK